MGETIAADGYVGPQIVPVLGRNDPRATVGVSAAGSAITRAQAAAVGVHTGVSAAGSAATQAHVSPAVVASSGGSVEMPRPSDDAGGIPRPVLIGAGVVGVLAVGLVIFKLTRR